MSLVFTSGVSHGSQRSGDAKVHARDTVDRTSEKPEAVPQPPGRDMTVRNRGVTAVLSELQFLVALEVVLRRPYTGREHRYVVDPVVLGQIRPA